MSTIFVIYHSDTGNTHKLARLVAEGIDSVKGAKATLVPAGELDLAAAAKADGYAIGSPDYFSYVAGEVKCFFDKILYDERFKGKPCVCFATHGGGGKVMSVLSALSKSCGLAEVAPGVAAQGAPGEKDAKDARDLGKALAKAAAG